MRRYGGAQDPSLRSLPLLYQPESEQHYESLQQPCASCDSGSC
jgi:hypothetical protein